MKNYKIIENRPELTSQQIMQGINFNSIKSNAALAQKAILKALIAKGLVTVALITSSVLVYKAYNKPSPQKQLTVIDISNKQNQALKDTLSFTTTKANPAPQTTSTKNKISNNIATTAQAVATQTSLATSNVLPAQVTAPLAVASPTVDSSINNPTTVTKPLQTFKNNKPMPTQAFVKSANASAKIWNSKNYCNVPNPNAEFKVNMVECDVDSINCNELNQLKNVVAVWVSVTAGKKASFNLQTNFANVSLLKSDGSLIHPTIVGFDGYGFIKQLKTESFEARFKNKLNIFLFFPDAKIGDKIIIDNFIQTQIQ